MKSIAIPITDGGLQTEGKCRDNSFYMRFTEDDVEQLALYAQDLNYKLEPDTSGPDQQAPLRFKITSKSNPSVYGWISKVSEMKGDQWEPAFLYGFYRHGAFKPKYAISFNVNSHQMRGIMKRNALKNLRQESYYRTLFGILDLEPQINPINFIFSWLWSLKFNYV